MNADAKTADAKAADAKSSNPGFVYLAAGISALGGMLFGYDIGVISGAILFIKKDFSLSAGLEEIVVSSVPLGSLVGAVALTLSVGTVANWGANLIVALSFLTL